MVEAIPVLDGSRIVGYLATSSDMTILNIYSKCRLYLWDGDLSIDITDRCIRDNFVIRLGDSVFEIDRWFEPIVFNFFRTINDIEDIVEIIYRTCKKSLEGSTIVLSYSGGKDSTAALLTLLKLSQAVNFKLHICYTYIPFLENIKNIEFVYQVASKLGIEIEVLSPPRRIVLKYLRKYGLPYRRCRWCTYLKVRPLREYFKKIGATLHAVGDRATECEKRWRRLKEYLMRQRFISRREFKPIYTLSLIDVINICRKNLLVNPQYLKGLQRVACVVCPYKSLPELYVEGIDNVEDPGLIESILRKEFYRWYLGHISYEDYIKYGLWRFVPRVAKLFSKLRIELGKDSSYDSTLSLNKYSDIVARIWKENYIDNIIKINFVELLKYLRKYRVSQLFTEVH